MKENVLIEALTNVEDKYILESIPQKQFYYKNKREGKQSYIKYFI